MTEWVWLDTTPRDAATQMAIDRAMVEVARRRSAAILRLYQWQHNTLSLGANEAAAGTWDRDRLEADRVPCVRRPTGGRGVWHADDDLTYAWAGPSGGAAGVRQVYRSLHERLGRALATAGAPTVLAARPTDRPDLRPGACFELAVGGELVAEGRKILGSAQRVFGHQLLQHGAFARCDRTAALERYRRIPGPAARSSRNEDPLPTAEELRTAIGRSWSLSGARPAPDALPREVEQASVEYQEWFRDPAWIWRR